MPDKYDEAIQRLREGQGTISDAWHVAGPNHPTGCLFQFVTPSGTYREECSVGDLGCLTMIRRGYCYAFTPEWTEAIRQDERLPKEVEEITLDHLEVFAEWQRKLDATLRKEYLEEKQKEPSDAR